MRLLLRRHEFLLAPIEVWLLAGLKVGAVTDSKQVSEKVKGPNLSSQNRWSFFEAHHSDRMSDSVLVRA